MITVKSGNLSKLVKKHPDKRGWIVGCFIGYDSFFQTDDFEIKWAEHKIGEIKKGEIASKTARTIGILIKGKYSVKLLAENREVILKKQGDYIAYDAAETEHIGEALEDSIVLGIRWPSKRD